MKRTHQNHPEAIRNRRIAELVALRKSGLRWVQPAKNVLHDIRVQIAGHVFPEMRTWPAWKILNHKQP